MPWIFKLGEYTLEAHNGGTFAVYRGERFLGTLRKARQETKSQGGPKKSLPTKGKFIVTPVGADSVEVDGEKEEALKVFEK